MILARPFKAGKSSHKGRRRVATVDIQSSLARRANDHDNQPWLESHG